MVIGVWLFVRMVFSSGFIMVSFFIFLFRIRSLVIRMVMVRWVFGMLFSWIWIRWLLVCVLFNVVCSW